MDEGATGPVNGELNGELNPSQKATLKFIMEHEGCTASEISKKLVYHSVQSINISVCC